MWLECVASFHLVSKQKAVEQKHPATQKVFNFHLLLWLLTSNLLFLLHSWSSCPWFAPVMLCPFFLTLALSLPHVYAYLLLSKLMCVWVCTKFYISTLGRSPCCPFYHIFEIQFMVKQESPDLAYLTRLTHCPINYTHTFPRASWHFSLQKMSVFHSLSDM